MRWKRAHWAWLVLASAFLTTIAFFQFDHRCPEGAGPATGGSPMGAWPPKDIDRVPGPSEPSLRHEPTRVFSRATNASDFLRNLEASELAPGEKQQFRLLVALLCDEGSKQSRDYLQKRDSNKRVLSASRKLSSSFSYEYFKAFCNVPGFRMTNEAAELNGIDPLDETVQALELVNLGESGESALATQRAMELLANADSAPAVSRSMDFLAGYARVAPLGSDLPFPEATAQEDFDAHRIAAARWSCEQRGGCGPEELFSVLACGSAGNCRPGITAAAAWRQGHRPGVTLRADEIHRRLAVLHANADAGRPRD